MSAAVHPVFTIYPRLTQPGYSMHTASSRAKLAYPSRRRARHSESTSTPTQLATELTPTSSHRPNPARARALAMTSGSTMYPGSSSSSTGANAPGSSTQRRRSRELAEMRQWSAQQQAALAQQQQQQQQVPRPQGQAQPHPSSSSRHQAASTATGSSSSAVTAKKRPTDPYYGHQSASTMASSFIISMFNCPNVPPTASVEPGAPLPTLAHFVAYALYRTRLPHFVTLTALLLLRRLKTRFPAARGSSGHRLFISAFMIASKVVCDDTYSNQSWCTVGQKMFSLKEMNQMEREMCGYLEWNLNATTAEVDELETVLMREHTTAAQPTTPSRPIAPLKKSAVSTTSAGIASAEAAQAHASASASVHGSPMSVASAAGTPSPQLVAHPPISSASQRPVAPLPRSASSSRRPSYARNSVDASAVAAAAAFPSNPYHSLATSRSQTQPPAPVERPSSAQAAFDRRSSMVVEQQAYLARTAGLDAPASRRDSAPVMTHSASPAGFGTYDQDAATACPAAQAPAWTQDGPSHNASTASVASQPAYAQSYAAQWPGPRSHSTSALHHLHPHATSHLSPYPGLVPSAMSSQQSSPESQACQTPSPANALGSASVVPAGAAMPCPGTKSDVQAIPHIPTPWSS